MDIVRLTTRTLFEYRVRLEHVLGETHTLFGKQFKSEFQPEIRCCSPDVSTPMSRHDKHDI